MTSFLNTLTASDLTQFVDEMDVDHNFNRISTGLRFNKSKEHIRASSNALAIGGLEAVNRAVADAHGGMTHPDVRVGFEKYAARLKAETTRDRLRAKWERRQTQ